MEKDLSLHGKLTVELTKLRRKLSLAESDSFDLKRLDNLIAELEELFYTFRANSREGTITVQDDRIVYANTAACKIFGYAQEELMNMHFQSLLVPNLRHKETARQKMLMAGDREDDAFEWEVLRKDRTTRTASVIGCRINFVENPATLYYLIDKSEYKQKDLDLEIKSQLLDTVSDSIILLHIDGRIVYVNKSACNVLGYTESELLKMSVFDLVSPELHNKFDIRLKQFTERNEASYNSAYLRKDGVRLPVEVRGFATRKGKQPLLVCIWHELTTLRNSK